MKLVKNLGMATLSSAVFLLSCGDKSDSNGTPETVKVSDFVADSQLTSGIINASHGDAVSAAADQGASVARFNLTQSGSDDDSQDGRDDDTTTVSKSCAASTDSKSAVVTLTSNINRSRTKSKNGGRITVTESRTGSGTATRTWTKTDGSAVACNSAGTGAAIDFKNPSGFNLEVVFQRSRTDTRSFSGANVSRSSSKSFTSSGKRTITWNSNDSSSDGASTYLRNKTVVIKDTTNSISLTNKDGKTFNTALTINTKEDAPLVVQVERNKTTNAVVSKTFVSGQVVVKKDSDATLVTTYNNLKLKFDDGSCSIISGSAQVAVSDSSGSTLKSWTLGSNSSGDDSLSDSSGTELDEFALDACDSEDLKL